jgi:hypothetical protein
VWTDTLNIVAGCEDQLHNGFFIGCLQAASVREFEFYIFKNYEKNCDFLEF